MSESSKDFGEMKGQGTRTGETNKRKSLSPSKTSLEELGGL